jgi:hypothetical protein
MANPSKTRTLQYCAPGQPPPEVLDWGRAPTVSTLDFSLDLRHWLADAGGDTVTSCSAAIIAATPGGDTTVKTQPVAGPILTTWLALGDVTALYAVQLAWSTAGGRSVTATVWLQVQPVGVYVENGTIIAVGPPGVIAVASPLVLQNGALSIDWSKVATSPGAVGTLWLDGDLLRVVTTGE